MKSRRAEGPRWLRATCRRPFTREQSGDGPSDQARPFDLPFASFVTSEIEWQKGTVPPVTPSTTTAVTAAAASTAMAPWPLLPLPLPLAFR